MAKVRKGSDKSAYFPMLLGLTVLVFLFIWLNGVINSRKILIESKTDNISEVLEVEETNKEISDQMKANLNSPAPTRIPLNCSNNQSWKEYINQKYSFCLSYSPNLILSTQSNDDYISLLERQNNGQDSILAQRLGIFIKENQENVSLESFVRSDSVATGDDANPNFENATYSGKPAMVVRKNKAAQEQYGINTQDIQQTVKALYIKDGDIIISLYPSDTVETQKSDWLSPILQTLRFSQ